ncbi:hypothetical protein RB653_005055 [Dictyostelium firmibasis]|uniref:Dickkopf N-terminal cysteine-rich domain-containing protein n=1 Tax=Dictyostelium firmibasis TaxID=79012 RepID=A0AAN7Z3T8_9MYCE
MIKKISFIFIFFLFLIKNNKSQCISCYDEGGFCMENINTNSTKDIFYNCRDGLVCAAKKIGDKPNIWQCLEPSQLNQDCTSDSSCSIGLICDSLSNKCLNSRFAGIGESCINNFDCSGSSSTCTYGVCTTEIGEKCKETSDCKYGSACNIANGTCKILNDIDSNCKLNSDCIFGLICNNGKCDSLFTKSEGDSCVQDIDCNQFENLYCSENTKMCEQYQIQDQSSTNCSLDNLCDKYHACSCDGNCYINYLLPTQNAIAYDPLIKCILENKCTWVNNIYSSNSCISRNCGKQLCFYHSTNIQDNPLTCGNSYESDNYCSINHSIKTNPNIVFIFLIIILISLFILI